MPEQGKWRLTVRSDFAAAHSLRNYGGACEALHGHNFAVSMTVEGDRLAQETELLVDFKELKRLLAAVLDELDHKFLNAIEPFATRNPSSENLARHIYRHLKPGIAVLGVRLTEVTVSEKPAQSAAYSEY